MASIEQTLKVAIDFTQIGLARAIVDVAMERQRQVDVEGYSAEHDDQHSDGALARAAACYASLAGTRKRELLVEGPYSPGSAFTSWPWESVWWKPTTPRRDLVKAAALIVAEIERLDRLAALSSAPAGSDDHPDVKAQRAIEGEPEEAV